MTKKPERCARVVKREATRQVAKGLWVWSDATYQAAVAILLRREHRAVVRLVTRMSKGQGETKSAPRETEEWMSSESWLDGYFHACNEMLATLARRVK